LRNSGEATSRAVGGGFAAHDDREYPIGANPCVLFWF
jgi:hypothetical protein